MANSPSALTWVWVIEALASLEQLDPSVLLELVRRVTVVDGDFGKDAKEWLYFRVLNDLASRRVTSNGIISLTPEVSGNMFDQSERCENVFQLMLVKTIVEAEMMKPEIRNFLTKKRASLPKCFLLKLKEAMLEGRHAALLSLRKRTRLPDSINSEKVMTVNDANSNEVTGLGDSQTVAEVGYGTCPNTKNLNGGGNLSKRRNVERPKAAPIDDMDLDHPAEVATENDRRCDVKIGTSSNAAAPLIDFAHEIICHEANRNMEKSQQMPINTGVKKHNTHDVNKKIERPKAALVDELDLDLPDTVVTKNDGRFVEIGTSSKAAAPSNDSAPENTCNEADLDIQKSQQLPTNNGVKKHNTHDCNRKFERPKAVLVDELDLDLRDEVVTGNYGRCDVEVGLSSKAAAPSRENTCDEADLNIEKFQRMPSNNGVKKHDIRDIYNFSREAPKHGTNHNPQQGLSSSNSDSDDDQDERIDTTKRKYTEFISSQCTFSMDSIADDCSELDVCIKCDNGGDVLVCGEKTCPIVVHQSCMKTSPSFDDSGNFLCPFCFSKRANAEYHEAKKRASLFRKNLAAFLGVGPRNN